MPLLLRHAHRPSLLSVRDPSITDEGRELAIEVGRSLLEDGEHRRIYFTKTRRTLETAAYLLYGMEYNGELKPIELPTFWVRKDGESFQRLVAATSENYERVIELWERGEIAVWKPLEEYGEELLTFLLTLERDAIVVAHDINLTALSFAIGKGRYRRPTYLEGLLLPEGAWFRPPAIRVG